VNGYPLILRSDYPSIANCQFKLGSTPHPCRFAKWAKYTKKVLVNGTSVIMNQFSGRCFAADNALQGLAIVSSIQRKVIGR